MPRPRPMKTMGPPGEDPPIEIVHFADPWCWWSWGLEPILQRLREVYGDNVQVTYKMGGEFETGIPRCRDRPQACGFAGVGPRHVEAARIAFRPG